MRLCWQASFLTVALGLSSAARVFADEGAPPRDPAPPSDPTVAPFDSPFGPAPARATIHPHVYTLAECLALADRNFPNLWAARARLAYAHAQLSEARWTPWFQWSAQSSLGVTPPLLGSVLYPQSTLASRNIVGLDGLQPYFSFGISGVVPLYTFGKIDAANDAAIAGVRAAEWDMEKARQAMRMDVRRAYFGLKLARDSRDVVDDAVSRLDKAIAEIKNKVAKGDPNVTEIDKLRLETYRQDVMAQSLQAPKGEAYAIAALRFMTGVETGFDIPDEPLRKPNRALATIVQYLEAARLLRPEINMARAGVAARKALLDYGHARLYPDFGMGLGADFISTPNATQQNDLYANDPYNHFSYYFSFGMKWSLDFLPQLARTEEAESQLEETRALERLAQGSTMLEVEKAYADVVEAKGREEAWNNAEHAAKRWIATVQDSIDLGTADERSLLEPLRVYGNARVQHLTALMDYNVSMSSLALASGWDAAAPTDTLSGP
ncbi:MAG TPA: TolC family protein [Polyangiaceae bacterium]|jgi:multidrug efflux system outer membrane protein|nr:TolC family protein [Polyangiaceae bacterium]